MPVIVELIEGGYRVRQWSAGSRVAVKEGTRVGGQLPLTLDRVRVLERVQLERLPQFEEVVLPPSALESLSDRFYIKFTVAVPELRQALRVPLAIHDSLQGGQPGLAGDVANDLGELDIHLFESFLPVQ